MEIDEHFDLEHLYLTERTCRVCGQTKDLIDGFYRSKKNKYQSSSYSYECKDCTIKRITESRNRLKKVINSKWEYPDW